MELKAGARVTCTIKGTEIRDAKLQYEDGQWYICQNLKDGAYCLDKLGYKYSWVFNKENPEINDIKNLRSLPTAIDDIYVGAKISREEGKLQEVLGI